MGLSTIFGTHSTREIKRIMPLVNKVMALEEEYSNLSDSDLVGKMASEGTTPRQLTDLIGSLCDLTSGSGDKGTPVVLVQGYFDNYTN